MKRLLRLKKGQNEARITSMNRCNRYDKPLLAEYATQLRDVIFLSLVRLKFQPYDWRLNEREKKTLALEKQMQSKHRQNKSKKKLYTYSKQYDHREQTLPTCIDFDRYKQNIKSFNPFWDDFTQM